MFGKNIFSSSYSYFWPTKLQKSSQVKASLMIQNFSAANE